MSWSQIVQAIQATATGGGGGLYLGQVATASATPSSQASSSLTEAMSRSRHYARDSIASLQLVYVNWRGAETATGAAATVTASVEYPAGVFTQVLFSGAAEGAIADGGQIVSDAAAVAIPDGAEFFVRTHFTCSAGFPFLNTGGDNANGNALAYSVSGIADSTMSDPMPSPIRDEYRLPPAAIIAQTRRPSVLLIGDSRTKGADDLMVGASGDVGQVARSIGPSVAYIAVPHGGERASGFLAANALRVPFAAYVSHVICAYGINDVSNGTQAAPLYALLASIRDLFPGQPFYQTTLTPNTTSTDAWATTGNQTVKASEAARVAVNGLIRGNAEGFAGVFEVADAVETARDSGIWRAPGYTEDGVHELNTANLAIQASGAIDPGLLTR